MKISLKIFTIAASIVGFSTASFAQTGATGTATATATIITPISITRTAHMNFGNVAVTTVAGTVILAPAGTRTTTGGVTLPTTGGTITAAAFTVNGLAGYTYTVTLPTTDLTITDGNSHNMIVNAFTSTPAGTAGLLTGGTQALTVGATLNVSAAQAAGTYVSATSFDVTVNYN
jgi:hypothetical protein